VVGIAGAATVFVLLAGTVDVGSSDEPSAAVSWIKLGLGVLLLLLVIGVVQIGTGLGGLL
jgi:hypothetical protein